MTHHHAPAGLKYKSIRDAGEQTLAQYCDRYPQSPYRKSYILPVLFETIHPENVDPITVGASVADQRKFTGLEINTRGERGEYEVYKVFYSLIRESPNESLLGLFGYNLDNDNGRNLKTHAIMNELPCIDLTGVNMKREHDMLVFVHDVGVVLCEIKSSASSQNMSSAESQLANSEAFVKQIMTAIAGPSAPQLPTMKLIIVPSEQSQPSPSSKINDCHVIFADLLSNFSRKWSQVINELILIHLASNRQINTQDFEKLVQFAVGVWTMKPISKRTYDFDSSGASMSYKIKNIDTTIGNQQFAPTKLAQEFSTDVATSSHEIFQRVDEMQIFYMNPVQKILYDQYRHALIHSHAGTGKTMLIIFKIIDILESDPSQKVLLIAPRPHHLRCEKILKAHQISTDVVRKFPFTVPARHHTSHQQSSSSSPTHPSSQPPHPSHDVLIITTKDFFDVTSSELMLYDLSAFNVFIDDIHFHKIPRDSNICTYTDIGNFIDTTYATHKTTDQYLWVACDIVQHGAYRMEDKRKPDQLFITSNGNTRIFQIPVIKMTAILRNTKEVSDVLNTARNEQSFHLKLDQDHVVKDISCGHHLTTGDRVLYEILRLKTLRVYDSPIKSFICYRVCELLRSLTTTSLQQPQNNFPFGTVAVLFDRGTEITGYIRALQDTLRTNFNIGTQTIEEQIVNNNNNDVVVDHCGNAQSFECATVMGVLTYGGLGRGTVIYSLISRARTKCVIVDVDITVPLPLQHVDVVVWEEKDGSFMKV